MDDLGVPLFLEMPIYGGLPKTIVIPRNYPPGPQDAGCQSPPGCLYIFNRESLYYKPSFVTGILGGG